MYFDYISFIYEISIYVLDKSTVITIKHITLENALKYINEIYNIKNELSKL